MHTVVQFETVFYYLSKLLNVCWPCVSLCCKCFDIIFMPGLTDIKHWSHNSLAEPTVFLVTLRSLAPNMWHVYLFSNLIVIHYYCTLVFQITVGFQISVGMGIFRLFMKGKYNTYLLWPIGKSVKSVGPTFIRNRRVDTNVLKSHAPLNYTSECMLVLI